MNFTDPQNFQNISNYSNEQFHRLPPSIKQKLTNISSELHRRKGLLFSIKTTIQTNKNEQKVLGSEKIERTFLMSENLAKVENALSASVVDFKKEKAFLEQKIFEVSAIFSYLRNFQSNKRYPLESHESLKSETKTLGASHSHNPGNYLDAKSKICLEALPENIVEEVSASGSLKSFSEAKFLAKKCFDEVLTKHEEHFRTIEKDLEYLESLYAVQIGKGKELFRSPESVLKKIFEEMNFLFLNLEKLLAVFKLKLERLRKKTALKNKEGGKLDRMLEDLEHKLKVVEIEFSSFSEYKELMGFVKQLAVVKE